MILIDTNVWVYSMRTTHPLITNRVRELMIADSITGHDFVHGELLIGVGGNNRKEVVDYYTRLKKVAQLPNADVITFVKKHKLENRGIGWVDAHLLAAAQVNGLKLWTEEKPMKGVAEALGIAYLPETQ